LENKKMLLMGDEAIAQGAIDAGISGMYAYPGTPSTEIMEYVQKSKEAAQGDIHREWSANEKTALEGAIGMSYTGKRVMACMKHVGLNVAADAFINSAMTSVNGGLLVAVADDPSMHSSQNEQDSRFYGKFSLIPTLEPCNQQEAYDMVIYGFDFSEKYHVPILLRITTRLAHSRSAVKTGEQFPRKELKLPENKRQYVLVPAVARKRYPQLLDKWEDLLKEAEKSPFNAFFPGKDNSIGILACGLAFNYLMENFQDTPCPYPVLKIGQYPLPRKMVEKLVHSTNEILVLEEGMPLIESKLKGFLEERLKVRGRMSGALPRDGELNPGLIRKALGMEQTIVKSKSELVVPRPPLLCAGCPHTDSFLAINEAVKDVYGDGHVLSDIGCYTLGALPPLESINSCVDMGASISMAKGAADAGLFPSVAVIGDSTFTHSGMTALLDAVVENSNIVVFIMDNSTTAMTGGQKSHAEGRIEKIVKGLGVKENHVRVIVPLKKNHEEFVKIIKEELDYNGVSVIIPTRECVQTLRKKKK